MDHGLFAPQHLVIVIGVFGETADVQHTELAGHHRETAGFTPVFDGGPHKSPCQIGMFHNMFPLSCMRLKECKFRAVFAVFSQFSAVTQNFKDAAFAELLLFVDAPCASAGGIFADDFAALRVIFMVAHIFSAHAAAVIAHHIHCVGEAVGVGIGVALKSHSRGPGGIKLFGEIMERFQHGCQIAVSLLTSGRVGKGPEDDGRMIPVPSDEVGQILFGAFVSVEISGFRPEEHPHPVAGLHKGRGGGIVGGADHIGAHLFQDFHILFMGAVGQGGAQTAEIVVDISAPQLQMSAVEEKSFVGGEFKVADPEREIFNISIRPVFQGYARRVAVGGVNVPEAGGINGEINALFGKIRLREQFAAAAACRIKDFYKKFAPRSGIGNFRFHMDLC